MDDEVMQKVSLRKLAQEQQLKRMESGMGVSQQLQMSKGATQESTSPGVSSIMICDRGTLTLKSTIHVY